MTRRTTELSSPDGTRRVRSGEGATGVDVPPEEIRAVPVRHPWRLVATILVSILVVLALWSIATNPRFRWDIVAQYLTEGVILRGLLLTLQLTAVSMVIGIVLGVLFALMSNSHSFVVAAVGKFYIWFFRGTPLLVQLIFWFNIAALYPSIEVGLPGADPWFTIDANVIVTPLMAGILGLGLNEGAYMAEIVRGGILAIDRGQYLASEALGMTRLQTMRLIVLPQAMRVIIPPTGNQTIAMLKNVSLVSVLAIPELLYSAQIIYSRNFQTIPLLIVASIWYLLCTSILTVIQSFIEKKFSPDLVHDRGLLSRVGRNLFRRNLAEGTRRTAKPEPARAANEKETP